jgi:hypothetical protein
MLPEIASRFWTCMREFAWNLWRQEAYGHRHLIQHRLRCCAAEHASYDGASYCTQPGARRALRWRNAIVRDVKALERLGLIPLESTRRSFGLPCEHSCFGVCTSCNATQCSPVATSCAGSRFPANIIFGSSASSVLLYFCSCSSLEALMSVPHVFQLDLAACFRHAHGLCEQLLGKRSAACSDRVRGWRCTALLQQPWQRP